MFRALVLVAAVVLAGCRGYGDVSKAVELNERDSGKSIDVFVTQVLIITLPANQSTPYHWVLTQEPNPAVLEKVANTYESEEGPPRTDGSEIWRFRAIGEGGTQLQLDYVSVDGGPPTGDRFSLSVRAQEGG
jgi:predicted secreted protein